MAMFYKSANMLMRNEKHAYFVVQIQQIKRKQAYADSDILNFDILALASTEFLEGHNFTSRVIKGHSLSIQHK